MPWRSWLQKARHRTKRNIMAFNLEPLSKLDGFIAASMVDSGSGMTLGSKVNGNFDIETASAGNTEVVRAKLKTMDSIGLQDETIEDILISLSNQYHLIRPLNSNREVFIYIALDRSKANLAMARIELKKFEGAVKL